MLTVNRIIIFGRCTSPVIIDIFRQLKQETALAFLSSKEWKYRVTIQLNKGEPSTAKREKYRLTIQLNKGEPSTAKRENSRLYSVLLADQIAVIDGLKQ